MVFEGVGISALACLVGVVMLVYMDDASEPD